jgi:hypothetical protein
MMTTFAARLMHCTGTNLKEVPAMVRPGRLVAVPPLVAVLALALLAFLPAAARAATATTTPIALGAYADGFSGAGSQVSQLEAQLGSRLAVASSFRGWGDLFPDATQQVDSDSGHTLLVAWDLGDTSVTRFSTFPAHAHDTYLAQEAAVAKRYGKTLYVRPWAEMNGDWSAFQPTPDGSHPAGGTYAQFVAAWRYVVDFFRNHGATNVRWVFDPTTDTYDGTTPVASIWPGLSWVDVLGLDGYNWGTGGAFSWRTFGDIYSAQYARLGLRDGFEGAERERRRAGRPGTQQGHLVPTDDDLAGRHSCPHAGAV